jgi:NTP pyrophosphatase (non-canonical NTP hydrolase)
MELSALVRKQIDGDVRRGFPVQFANPVDRQEQLSRELVGLVGEVGEFANLLKKVSLASTTKGYQGPTLEDASAHLREELADAAIYLFRLSAILGGDFEQDLVKKMAINDERYRDLER